MPPIGFDSSQPCSHVCPRSVANTTRPASIPKSSRLTRIQKRGVDRERLVPCDCLGPFYHTVRHPGPSVPGLVAQAQHVLIASLVHEEAAQLVLAVGAGARSPELGLM